MLKYIRLFSLVAMLLFPGSGWAQGWEFLENKLVGDGFNKKYVAKLFARTAYDARPMRKKMRVLHKINFGARRVGKAQKGLAYLGYKVGKVDGRFGAKTAAAIRAFQKDQKLPADTFPVDGVPSNEFMEVLDTKLPKSMRAAPSSSWHSATYKAVRNALRLAEAREFYLDNRVVLEEMQRKYQVPGAVVCGILTVETRLGTFLGGRKAFSTLASMAAGEDYERIKPFFKKKKLTKEEVAWLKATAKKRGNWAYEELKALIKYAQANKQDPLELQGSIYGAIGIGQFMPTSAIKHAVDGDGDGDVDLFTLPDAINSVGSYLKGYGWAPLNPDLKTQRTVLFAYNHSKKYVNSILAVAKHIQTAMDGVVPIEKGVKYTKVATPREFLQALERGARIQLTAKSYDLSKAADVGTKYVRWVENDGVKYPVVTVSGVRIKAPASTLVRNGKSGGLVLTFEKCDGVFLENITFQGQSGQKAPLLRFDKSSNMYVNQCVLDKASVGMLVSEVSDFVVANTIVQECGQGVFTAYASKKILFSNCVLRSNTGKEHVYLEKCADVAMKHCIIEHNAQTGKAGYLFFIKSNKNKPLLTRSCIRKNTIKEFSNGRGSMVLKNNYIKSNKFRVR